MTDMAHRDHWLIEHIHFEYVICALSMWQPYFFRAIPTLKAMYSRILSSVPVMTTIGLVLCRQRSQTVFLLSPALFIHQWPNPPDDLGIGIHCESKMISILVYVDDIILLTEKEQKLLDLIHTCCSKWGLSIFILGRQFPQTDFNFQIGTNPITLVHTYKWLGFWIMNIGIWLSQLITLSQTHRSLSRLNSKSIDQLVGYHTQPTLNSSSPLWLLWWTTQQDCAFKFPSKIQAIQNTAMRFFLNVSMSVPIVVLQEEMSWVLMRFHTRLAVLRIWHRLCTLPDGRWKGIIQMEM